MIDLSSELRCSAIPGTHVGDCMTRAADEIERLRTALHDMIVVAERDGWASAMTGRDLILRAAREALGEHAPTKEG